MARPPIVLGLQFVQGKDLPGLHGMTPDMSPRGPRQRRVAPSPKAKRVTFRLDHHSKVIPEVVEAGAPRSTEDLARENLSSIVENHVQLMRTLGGMVSIFSGDSDSEKIDTRDTGNSSCWSSTSRVPGAAEELVHTNLARIVANHEGVKRAFKGCFAWTR
mmetsp:Transcript_26567/g.84276  ORF Transcript_26567/g.84276 Transcript_26567/m.84276 type:complete len:160 (-) Transcript_26567:152-631(-)